MEASDGNGLPTLSYLLNLAVAASQQLQRPLIGCADQSPHLLVDELGRELTVGLLGRQITLPGEVKGDLAQLGIHTELYNLKERESNTMSHARGDSGLVPDHQVQGLQHGSVSQGFTCA